MTSTQLGVEHGEHLGDGERPATAAGRPSRAAPGLLSVVAGTLVMYATRSGVRVSPDSLTYLSAAEHLHNGVGMADFTGMPLTVFGPLYPLLLAPGGGSLLWMQIVGAALIGLCCWLLFLLLERRVTMPIAIVAVGGFGLSLGMVEASSSGWSEPLYIAVTLAMLVVLEREPLTLWRCAAGGAVAAAGLLVRYAGVGAIVAALVVVAFATRRWASVMVAAASATALAGGWLLRNTVTTGSPVGPRFAGGLDEDWQTVLARPLESIGKGLGLDGDTKRAVAGGVVIAMVAIAVAIVVVSKRASATDVGMIALAAMSVLVPVVARMRTASDVSPRVMSPMLAYSFYLGAVVVHASYRRWFGRPMMFACVVAIGWMMWQGVAFAKVFPERGSSASRSAYSSAVYDEIDALPADVRVLTNNPWGVWWQSRREPTLMAFTRPRVGNSHRPISSADLVKTVCAGPTVLAWFSTMDNAGDGPTERRPDLVEVVELRRIATVLGGVVYNVIPVDSNECEATAE